jgi:HEAT repeat protein
MLRRTSAVLAAFAFAGLVFAAPAEEEAKKYAADLKHKDAKVRLEAAKELGRLGGAKKSLVAPYLDDIKSAMKDKDAGVRGEAAKTLGIADPQDKKAAVKAIADLLKEEKSEMARAGMETGLGELGAMADEDAEAKKMARDALLEARKKYTDSKREQKVIQAALILINGPKKKKN